jgi:hypothetical protein
MGKNGGDMSTDTVLTLEEALMRFKRKREGGSEGRGEGGLESNVHHADFSGAVGRETKGTTELDLETAYESASVSAQRDEANAEMSASDDIVAMIEGIPRTLAELERIAAAEKAYAEDFPENGRQAAAAEVEDDADLDDVSEIGDPEIAALANRHALIRDYAFTAMGSALMVLVAFMVTRVPIVNGHRDLTMMADSIEIPALKAPTLMSAQDAQDLVTTLVTVPPDNGEQVASAGTGPGADELEERIKGALKTRAFTDIGVSVSKQGDAYLAGEVFSLDEAHKIARIVHSVNGVSRVHFLHPDVHTAQGPAYFGATTAWAPDVWGAKVRAVFIGSPADKAGIHPGDVISEFDGKTIPDGKTFNDLIGQYSPGQRVQFRVWHDGQPEYLVARLGEMTTVASR